MESTDPYTLPNFTYHEACLLTVRLTAKGLPDLHQAPEPTAKDELAKRTPNDAATLVRHMRSVVRQFLDELGALDLSTFWDIDDLRPKLEHLSDMQQVGLYYALKKYFWQFEQHPTQADAFHDAGFFAKDKLAFAQRVEVLDRQRRAARDRRKTDT